MIAGEVFLLQYWMISIINHYGYLGIALLILIENLFPPIPSEVILTFGGFLTTYTNMNLIGVILFSMSLMPWNGSTAKEIIPSFSAGLFQL